MVVFTCQHCGDSVNKQRVEKHYTIKCRFKSPQVTCIDCLKDFNGDEYNAHTQCVTEAERYSAKGTVFKQPSGQAKQAKYQELIHNLLNSKALTVIQRNILEVLSSHDNVPRKLNKFKNFMMNISKGGFTSADVEVVFKLIEEAWKTEQQQSKINGHKKEDSNKSQPAVEIEKDNSLIEDNEVNGGKESDIKVISDENEATDSKTNKEDSKLLSRKELKKQKKYEKYLMELSNEGKVERNYAVEENDEGGTELKKSKKSKRHLMNLENHNNTNGEPANAVKDVKEKKHKKNKIQPHQISSEDLITNGESTKTVDEAGEENNKKKSKKGKRQQEDPVNGGSDLLMDVQKSETKPKKSKKRKLEDSSYETTDKKQKLEDETSSKVQTKFDWAAVIVKVLESRPDKEITIKKLGKKVVSEYQAVIGDHHTYNDLLAKFNNKIKKTPGVKVLKDRATLIS